MTAETAPSSDISEIVPDTRSLEIEGIEVEVRRLKTREFLALMKMLLRGMGGDLASVFQTDDPQQMQGRLMGALLVAIPNAENDFILFLQRIVAPKNDKQKKQLMEVLENPEMDDLLAIATVVIEQEAADFARLGKAARTWWETTSETLKASVADG